MNHYIIDSEFDKKLSTAYQLSILAGVDSLVYFIFDSDKEGALVLKYQDFQSVSGEDFSLQKQIENILSREELLGYLFRRVKIALPHVPAATVPERLYNEAEKSTYLRELSDFDSKDSVFADEVPEMALRVLYPADSDLVATFKRHFPTCRFYSPVTPFLEGCLKMMENEEGHSVFVHFLKETMLISLFEKQNLLFYNSFAYASAGDVLYYSLLAFNQFKLDPTLVPVRLSGQIMEDSEIFKMLYRYITNLRFLKEPAFLKFGRRFGEIPSHLFFDLYSLALCK